MHRNATALTLCRQAFAQTTYPIHVSWEIKRLYRIECLLNFSAQTVHKIRCPPFVSGLHGGVLHEVTDITIHMDPH